MKGCHLIILCSLAYVTNIHTRMLLLHIKNKKMSHGTLVYRKSSLSKHIIPLKYFGNGSNADFTQVTSIETDVMERSSKYDYRCIVAICNISDVIII